MAHSFGFWLVGTPDTSVFRLPLCRQRSERLFLCLFLLIPCDEPLSDDDARIPIGMAAQVARGQRHSPLAADPEHNAQWGHDSVRTPGLCCADSRGW